MEIFADDVVKLVRESEMVLIGIGEEFERKKILEHDREYCRIIEVVRGEGVMWAIPYINTLFLSRMQDEIVTALEHLRQMIKGKNYFIVSVCMNGFLQKAGFKEDRIVEPCGGYSSVQCVDGCQGSVEKTNAGLLAQVEACCRGEMDWRKLQAPTCSSCGAPKIFNSLYADKYLEEGYLQNWAIYMKWLQGTLNRKLCVLELGVGLTYPSVIRWPFEKTAYFNKKAVFIRIHENLYQLTEELKEQGRYVRGNAVDLLGKEDACCFSDIGQ
ncbi:MAG: hypothetical protein HDR26_09140 [Lachnospiraceae bacterium]|nr:hypothetical protein [Lachnospiraceae bacterium]